MHMTEGQKTTERRFSWKNEGEEHGKGEKVKKGKTLENEEEAPSFFKGGRGWAYRARSFPFVCMIFFLGRTIYISNHVHLFIFIFINLNHGKVVQLSTILSKIYLSLNHSF